ncbi:hypothetical protein OHA72_57515 [Dactylosporangium sp. NBC_01737]|uniref:hypothetical protein n=1 Tax=Dactylosporangium sp. NBC_01737 TaxID=2975959 RepID=UPI002E0D44BB|nr:hypothetical protein OHA72_57515 [Dactylosporangium sp. NBC_01737]
MTITHGLVDGTDECRWPPRCAAMTTVHMIAMHDVCVILDEPCAGPSHPQAHATQAATTTPPIGASVRRILLATTRGGQAGPCVVAHD